MLKPPRQYNGLTWGERKPLPPYSGQSLFIVVKAQDYIYWPFSDRTIADRTLVQTVFVARCDIPWAPMLKHPIKRCHLKKWILRTDRSCPSPSGSKILAPRSAAVFSSSLLHRRHRLATPLAPPLAAAITALQSPRRHCRATAIAAIIAKVRFCALLTGGLWGVL